MSNDLGQIHTVRDGHVLEIVIDRPKTKNALTIAMYAELTRAVKAGEDLRAGRWWWEGRDTKECGLHEQNIKH